MPLQNELYQSPSRNIFQLKSLEQPLAAITAVQESAKALEVTFDALRSTLNRLPEDYRDSVASELREKIEAWLEDAFVEGDGEASTNATAASGRPQVKRSSLAGCVVAILLEKGPMSLKDLVAQLQAVGHPKAENFRMMVNTALWRRRKDVFSKKDGVVSLRTPDIELVE